MLQTKQKYTEQQLSTQSSYSVQQIWHKEPTREGLIRARDAIVPCTMCTSNHERQTWRVNCHKHQISSGAVYFVTNMRQNTKIHLNFHNERCRDRDVDTDCQVQTSLPKIQPWPKKRGHRLMTIILSNLNRLKKFTGRFLGKFAVKWILKIPSHLAYVATLPCETLLSAKQALNDKLQGSVAAYLRCSGVVNNQIRKDLLLSLWVKFF